MLRERTLPELGTVRGCAEAGLLVVALLLPEVVLGLGAVAGLVAPGVEVGLLLTGCAVVGLLAGAG